MERRNKLIMSLSLFGLVLMAIGITYAYFSANITGKETASTIVVTGGIMQIEYSENSSVILVENIYPREEEWVTKTITVKGTNTTDLKMNYKLGLDITENGFTEGSLTYSLTNNNPVSGTPIDNKNDVGIPTGTNTIYFGNGQFANGRNVEHIYTLKIYLKDSGTNQNANQNKRFNGKVIIEEDGTGDKVAAPEHWNDAPAGSLLAGIKANNSAPSANTCSIPGKEISCGELSMEIPASEFESIGSITYSDTYEGLETSTTSTTYAEGYNLLVGKYVSIMDGQAKGYIVDATSESASYIPAMDGPVSTEIEAILGTTEDDYGTSYYYRGAVENNYVSFAGMCWRIVRIDGLGNTKLVLYNYNPTDASNPCVPSLDGVGMAFARYDNTEYGQEGASNFNTNYNKNTYVGYMYSNNPDSSDYNIAHANDKDSAILTNLKKWYDAKFSASQKEMLADVIWCNDKRVVSDTTYDPRGYGNILGTGIGVDNTYYQASKRLITGYNTTTGEEDTSEAAPSLKCGESKEDNKISKFTASTSTDGGYGNGALQGYKIGLLTADEIAFAGATANSSNSSYYLYKNAGDGDYWTLSPWFSSGQALVFLGSFSNIRHDRVSHFLLVRPSVSLKSTVSITSGTGTQESPFVVSA